MEKELTPKQKYLLSIVRPEALRPESSANLHRPAPHRPIAERPNLLLKGSGRVNRILGPDEELTSPLEKSLRQARRQREQ
jgi:hypothetical protein